MADLYQGLQEASGTIGAPPPRPAAPPGLYDGLQMAPTVAQTAPREPVGALEALQAGIQGSAPGLAWRGRLPDLVINPANAKWWERALSGVGQVGAELPLMIGGAIAGAPAGAALGTAIAPGAGTAAGTLLGAGLGMGAVPAAIRESLIQAYKSGEVMTAADYWNAIREVAKTTAMEAGINAAAMGAGALAGRALGTAIAPSIGTKMTVGTATAAIETADIAAQIALMPTIPAAFQGRLPDAQEFLDAAILIGGLKAAHVTAQNITSVFLKTGKTPAEQVAEAQANPETAREMTEPAKPVPETIDEPLRLEMLRIQENLFRETDRLNELDARATGTPGRVIVDDFGVEQVVPGRAPEFLTDAERTEMTALRARVAELESQAGRVIAEAMTPAAERATYTPDQLTEAGKMAADRLTALETKAAEQSLTDRERAERVYLANTKEPDALARHFGLEPLKPPIVSRETIDASAQRVHDDVLRQIREADDARTASGLQTLGDDHAMAVAALVRARVRTRAERLGMLPEDVYNERPVQIIDETTPEVAAAEAAIPPDAPRFEPPETDLFGNPVATTNAPRAAVESLATVEVPLANLILSKEVPQFKHAADAKGVIVPLGGSFDRTGVGPIQVWERLNGQLEIISGRHRFDLAQRSGEETIPAQIHREADGFDARQAAILDAELNIREEQGSVADYVQYFKDSSKTREAAEQLGLLARAKGKAGFAIARDGSNDLIAAHRAGQLSDEAALSISSTAPGSDRLQALGIAMVNQGKSILIAVNTMRAVDLMAAERMAAGTQGDIFGFDDSAMREASTMAKKASAKQRAISEQIAAVNGASKRPELARKMGVDVADPEGIQKKIIELRQEQYLWDNWPLYPELVAKLRGETALKQSEVPNIIERVLAEHGEQDSPNPADPRTRISVKTAERLAKEGHPDAGIAALLAYVSDDFTKMSQDVKLKNPATQALVQIVKDLPPNPSGDLYRVLAFATENDRAKFVKKIRKGAATALQSERPVMSFTEDSPEGTTPMTNIGRDVASQFGEHSLVIQIASPRGQPLNIGRDISYLYDGSLGEGAGVEYLIPRDTQFKTSGVEMRNGEPWVILEPAAKQKNPVLFQAARPDEFPLLPETPAEATARDSEAAMEATRRIEEESPSVADIHAVATRYQVKWDNDATFMAFTKKLTGKEHLDDLTPAERKTVYDHIQGVTPDQTETPAFKRWFGAGNVTGVDKKPLEVYHYTNEAFDVFKSGSDSGAIWFTGRRHAPGDFAGRQREVAAYITIKKPYRTTNQYEVEEGPNDPQFMAKMRKGGYDGIIYADPKDMTTSVGGPDMSQFVVFDPKQVKSATDNRGTFDPSNANILFQSQSRATWYKSALGEAINNANMKSAPPKGWLDLLKGQVAKGGVKADEIKWSGVEEWLQLQEGKVTKEQVADYLKSNGVKVEEVTLGESPNGYDAFVTKMEAKYGEGYDTEALTPAEREEQGRLWGLTQQRGGMRELDTKFGQYQLPGGENYRELLLTLPTKGERARIYHPDEIEVTEARGGNWRVRAGTHSMTIPRSQATTADAATYIAADIFTQSERNRTGEDKAFQSSHFDQPNILAHIRFNERTDADGKRVLFIEEFQSDWAQKGKKEGFRDEATSERIRAERDAAAKALEDARPAAREAIDRAFVPIDGVKPASWVAGEGRDWRQKYEDITGHTVKDDDAIAIDKWIAATEHLTEKNAELRKAQAPQIPAAPFVGKTDAWVALSLKRMIRYAAENGFDRIAWTRGEQQVERYTSALRKAVDAIEWKKTPEGVQLVGYKGSIREPQDVARLRGPVDDVLMANDNLGFDTRSEARQALLAHSDWAERWGDQISQNGRNAIDAWRTEYLTSNAAGARRDKVVDTTEKEDALSDSIGKAMADRIINDPNQSGTIEGDNITVSDTGMAGFYDRIVPSVANGLLKKLGGGKVGEAEIDQPLKRGERPEILPVGPEPEFDSMSDGYRQTFQGAENFRDGEPPVIADELTFNIDGQPHEAMVVISPDGVHAVFDGFEMRADIPPQRTLTQDDAVNWVLNVWNRPGFWQAADVIVGEIPVTGVGKSKQPAIDITPAMRAKAMEGLPLFQQHRGSYDVAENLITIMQGADKSTVVHELGHSWLEEMKIDARRPEAKDQIRADWDILRRELAIGEDGEISRASHEQFARSVERYLAEGKAPSRELQGVFDRFKEWLLDIYRDLRNLNVEINPELRGVLDRMLATDAEIQAARDLGVPRAYVAEAAAAEAARIVPPEPPPVRKIAPGFKAEQASMEPYADELPPGPGAAPDNTHVNYAYINTPTDVKLAMQRMAEIDQANIQRQRGGTDGVKSWAESNAEQAKYVNDILGGNEDTLRILQPRDPDQPGPDVRLGILKKLAVGAAKDSARLRDVVLQAGHDATVRQQLEYMGSIERARMIQAEFLGERASVARALNALKDVTEGTGEISRMLEVIGLGDTDRLYQAARTPEQEQAFLKAKLDEILLNYKGKSVLDIAKLHKEIGTLKGTFKFTKEVTKATKWEMVVEGWKAGLLSGPVTHTTNLFGTGAFQVMRMPVDALAAIIGTARGASPGMGESDRASMSEAVARLSGWLGGAQEGIKMAVATYRLDDPTGKTEAYRTAIPGRAGEIIRIPLRLMGATDALVSTMYTRGEMRTLAIRQAFDDGLNPATREFSERVQKYLDQPTEDMQAQAEAAATRMTFNAPLGEKGVTLQLFVNKWNLQWMIPFIRTPINIAKELARMSPFAPVVGEWRAAMAKGGVERDRALAEMAIGTGIFAVTMAYALTSDDKGRKRLTGGMSPDPGKNRGKVGVEQPYSILIGDTYYEYARIQPTGTLLGLAADVAGVWDHMTEEEKDKIPKMLAAAFAQAVTNQTFLQGITNFVNAMSDPTRFAPRFFQQLAGSMVPNIIGQPTTMADPVVREVNGMLDAVMARLPGMRQELLPKRDWLGQPVETKDRVAVVLPSRTLPVTDDKVRLEAARLDISMAAPPKKTHIGKGTGKMGDVQLTPEEQDTFEKVSGEFIHKILANVVNAPGYDQIPDLVKRRIFSQVMTAGHRIGAVAALPMDKRIAYIESISQKMAMELQPGEPQ